MDKRDRAHGRDRYGSNGGGGSGGGRGSNGSRGNGHRDSYHRQSSRDYGESGSSRGYGESGSSRDYGQSGSSRDYRDSGSSRNYGEPGPSRDYGHSGSSRGYGHSGSSRGYGNSGHSGGQKRQRDASMDSQGPPKRRDPPAAGKKGRLPKIDLILTRDITKTKSGLGTDGQPEIALKANYFRVSHKPNWQLYQYHVNFEPEVETVVRRKLFATNVKDVNVGIFDGSTLITDRRFEDKTIIEDTDMQIKIEIKYIKDVNYLMDSFVQILNKIIRTSMGHLGLQQIGRNLFDPIAARAIQQNRITLWPGYKTSIRQHENEPLLCVEIKTKIMRDELLYDILMTCLQNHRDGRDQFTREVLGATVLTDYNNKTYRIDEVDWDKNPRTTFDTKNGPVSFIDYYQKRYNIRIRDPQQPLLLSRSSDRQRRGGQSELIYLVPELCRATGLTEQQRSNFQFMRSIAEYTRESVDRRVRRLETFNERLRKTPNSMQVLNRWGMSLDNKLVQFKGRILRNPSIIIANRVEKDLKKGSWRDQLRAVSLDTPLENWYLICTERDERTAQNFVQELLNSTKSMSFTLTRPRGILTARSDQNNEYIRLIEEAARNDPQIILIFVPNNKSDRYGAIKKKAYLDRSILTQVVTFNSATRKNVASIATNIAIQMACKIGAAPWKVDIPLTNVLTIGFDVTHDTNRRGDSFGALVASLDRHQTKYYSVVSRQTNGVDLSNAFTLNVISAVRAYREQEDNENYKKGDLPARIFIYRDGVGEGQLQHIIDHELEPVKSQLDAIYKKEGVALKLSFFVVNKRGNTRLFTDDNRNPGAGTVVDDVITLPERYDFFLVPVEATQGTVSPTYYNVIYDTVGLPPDKIQALTYRLCFGYFNWPGPIKVPAVCQYAAKLALLCGQHLHAIPAATTNQLEKKLYFL